LGDDSTSNYNRKVDCLPQNYVMENAPQCMYIWTTDCLYVQMMFTGTSIGKRYARTDELGVPFAITVDSTSSATIRERDSKDQIRVNVEEVATVVKDVTDGRRTWEDVWSTFPHHSSGFADE
jgi:glycyl-tRNA synthetase (class II)